MQPLQTRQFLKFTSSATSGTFQSHCLRSHWKIIDTTERIEVSGLNTLSHFIHIHVLMSYIARYTESDFSLLRSKIRELHPIHRASLGALSQHLLRVASHSDENAMTVESLAAQFCNTALRGNQVLHGGVNAKARCNYLL